MFHFFKPNSTQELIDLISFQLECFHIEPYNFFYFYMLNLPSILPNLTQTDIEIVIFWLSMT